VFIQLWNGPFAPLYQGGTEHTTSKLLSAGYKEKIKVKGTKSLYMIINFISVI
jgi:hypothetical protein